MVCRAVIPFPVVHVSPAVQAVRDWCAPARVRSWALQGLSGFLRDDVVRLVAKSESLRGRSRQPRIHLLS